MTRYFNITFQGQKYPFSSRDSQRGKVYRAERSCFRTGLDGTGLGPWTAHIGDGTLEDATNYVRQIASSRTWKKLMASVGRGGNWVPPVHNGRSNSSATGSPLWGIALPGWARTKPVILHELSHAICPSGTKHHWLFVHVYIKLVSRFMGPEWAQKLRREMRKLRVKFNPPKPKKALTEEQKQILRERAAKARAAKAANEAARQQKAATTRMTDSIDSLRKAIGVLRFTP